MKLRQSLTWFCTASALAASPTQAAWYQASSKHFVIYSDDNPKRLRDFAERLERFDGGVRHAQLMDDPSIGDGNRLTLFVLPKAADVRALVGDKSGFLDGFYTGRISGPLAYIGKDTGSYGQLSTETIFFHEYTHHLMMQDVEAPYPEWYVEGFAEFYSTPKFDHDGSVWFGVPANHRAWGLFNGPKIPVEGIFGGMKPSMTAEQREVFYGRSWLLTHYLLTGGKRNGQLVKYVRLLAGGTSSLDAARQAFGDLTQLDHELDAYQRGQLVQFKIAASNIPVGGIEVTPLSVGAAQVILTRAKVKYALKQPMDALAAEARAVEGRFPGDPLVERTLAEAELDADHPQAAEAAADRALKAAPLSTEAMVLKGRALAAEGSADDENEKAEALFHRAREILVAANKIDTEDPEPLYEYYHTYVSEGMRPTDNALSALHYASDLAPQDFGVRVNSAIAYLNEGKFKEARSTLAVVAYSPHAGSAAGVAKRMIVDIDAGKGKAALEDLKGASQEQSGSQ